MAKKKERKVHGMKVWALLLMGAIMASGYGVMKAQEPAPEMETYIVEVDYGDTLWDICGDIAANKVDVREVIYRTMEDNHIDKADDLQPGQMLLVRVPRCK